MRDQTGFTLLELLIAMTLMAMVLAVLYGGMHTAIRGWDSSQRSAERLNEIGLVQDFIRRQLSQSLTLFRNDPDQGQVVEFLGEQDRLRMIGPMLGHLGQGGLYVIELMTAMQGSSGQLRLRWYPYRPGQPIADGDEQETVLLDHVTALQWAYFGAQQGEETPRWHESWLNSKSRPELVRLSLRLRSDALPDLVAVLPD